MEHQQNQPPQGGVPGPAGRRLHIAHRRSPSELTPLMSMFSSPGSKLASILSVVTRASAFKCAKINTMLIHALNSGTACDSAADRIAPATTAADPSYPPTICEHGHDSSYAAPCSWWIQPSSTADAEFISTKCLPVQQSNATAADECTNGCAYTAFITSSKSIGTSKYGHGSASSSFIRTICFWL